MRRKCVSPLVTLERRFCSNKLGQAAWWAVHLVWMTKALLLKCKCFHPKRHQLMFQILQVARIVQPNSIVNHSSMVRRKANLSIWLIRIWLIRLSITWPYLLQMIDLSRPLTWSISGAIDSHHYLHNDWKKASTFWMLLYYPIWALLKMGWRGSLRCSRGVNFQCVVTNFSLLFVSKHI